MKTKIGQIRQALIITLLLLSLSITLACQPKLPEVETLEVIKITDISATVTGRIISDGGAEIISKGICWSITPEPTLENSVKDVAGDPDRDSFVTRLEGLEPKMIYYVRAYAKNRTGTSYGNILTFETEIYNVTDIDGNIYGVIKIGDRYWMDKNLQTTKYKDGTDIENNVRAWVRTKSGAYSWYNNNETGHRDVYGLLYNFYAVQSSKLCPEGWRVASHEDWTDLVNYLGGVDYAGGKLKEDRNNLWNRPNVYASNESGFSGVPGGFRNAVNGRFQDKGKYGVWWLSDNLDNSNRARGWELRCSDGKVRGFSALKNAGFSVRCVME